MSTPTTLVLACGALARELLAATRASDLTLLDVHFLPAWLHNRPELIPAAVAEALDLLGADYDRVLLGYGDCGTGGLLDNLCAERGIERLDGAHCYEFLAGTDLFNRLHDAEPGTFYLTDYLARHFDRLILDGLGIDRHPELEAMYFGHYRKLVHLAQVDDPAVRAKAKAAADRLGLIFEHHHTGLDGLTETLVSLEGPHLAARALGQHALGQHAFEGHDRV